MTFKCERCCETETPATELYCPKCKELIDTAYTRRLNQLEALDLEQPDITDEEIRRMRAEDDAEAAQ